MLKFFYDILEPNSRLLIKVPAHMFLFSKIDEASLHYRRYNKKELKNKLLEVGFKIEECRYMNMAGAILYFLKGKVLNKEEYFANVISENKFDLINKLVPLLEFFEKFFPVFWGLSVIAVAKKC